jgi:hypothetical protein
MRLTLYGKPQCSLCDYLKADLQALQASAAFQATPFQIDEINIESDAALQSRFQYLVPVLELPDGTFLYPPHDFLTLHNALLTAGQDDRMTG